MDTDTYEQTSLPQESLGARAGFLQDGMKVEIESYEGSPLGVNLPEQITLEVRDAEPVVKGQTAAASYKPATMDNGMRIMVPPFISQGEKIVVDTNTSQYMRRADKK